MTKVTNFIDAILQIKSQFMGSHVHELSLETKEAESYFSSLQFTLSIFSMLQA